MDDALRTKVEEKVKILENKISEVIKKQLAKVHEVADQLLQDWLGTANGPIDWPTYYSEQDKLTSEIREISSDISLLGRVLSGEIEFDGTEDKLFQYQLEMGSFEAQIQQLVVKKLETELHAHKQATLLDLLS